MELIVIVAVVILLVSFVFSKAVYGILNVIFYLFFGRTYSRSDVESQLKDARREVRKGRMTQDQFDDLEYELKKIDPKIKNY